MLQLARLLDILEAFHGEQLPSWPTDPYLFLVWWHCGYPASDASCTKGWESLRNQIGVAPNQLLSANPSELALALKPGGMVPELRAMRLKEIAAAVPSNCPHVLVRIKVGHERENYGMTYSEAQRMVEAEVPASFDA